jgi:hypothetical protein
MTVAIVTTQRTWTPESEPWANYHLSLGFTKIYVFVDDGRADYLPSSPAVQLIPTSREYWESHTPNEWQHYLADVRRDYGAQDFGSPENLTKRQVLNANAGLAMAIANGIDWILHIDDDEYFWCPDSSADQHFDALTRAGVNNVVYLNHEAVLFGPETPPEKRCRTVFKKNWTALWEHQRNNIHQVLPGKPYFSCYSNGKAAARCLPGITVPNGAHSMWINDPMLAEAKFCRPGILHRPYKDASQFCNKYLSQGTFSTETLLGKPWNLPEIQAKAQQLVAEQDLDGLRSLYEQAVTVSEAERLVLERDGYLLLPDTLLPFDEEILAAAKPPPPAHRPMTAQKMNVAITSMQRTWTEASEPWVQHHLSLGFTKIYVFVDSGRIDYTPSSSAVELIPCTKEYWDSLPSHLFGIEEVRRDFGTAEHGTPERSMHRQIINTTMALQHAARDGMDWLLHIDDDEYFWSPNKSVGEYFSEIPENIGTVSFVNHEAVLFSEDTDDVRRQRSFKKNWASLTTEQHSQWYTIIPGKPYFSSYCGVKTAARVAPGALPDGVHKFFVDAAFGSLTSTLPCLLHRPYKSVNHFCDKHMSLGTWPTDRVFGGPWNPPEIYVKAEELVRRNDIEGLRSLYSHVVAWNNNDWDRMEAAGFVVTIDEPLPYHPGWQPSLASK